jgi:hypothetical protein
MFMLELNEVYHIAHIGVIGPVEIHEGRVENWYTCCGYRICFASAGVEN